MGDSLNTGLRQPPPSLLTYEPNWKLRYSSDLDDFVEDFFVPALGRAEFYDRVAGYFTLGGLARIGAALEPFWDRGRKIRLVTSVHLQEDDVPEIGKAYEEVDKRIEQGLETERPDFSNALSLLTGFLVEKRLELYIATGYLDGSTTLYHEKIGVIGDADGNFLTFSGSPNETYGGLSDASKTKKNEISVLGSIAAGTPIEAIQNEVSRIPLPSNIEKNGEFFGLKVKGDSMVEAGINDGDTVIIKKADRAENGKIVVALIDDHEAMLKRIRIKGKTVALESANRNYETKIFGPDRVKVQGILISLYRNFN